MRRLAFVAALAVALLAGSSARALRLPSARHCPVFPANNAWNQRVDKLPVATDSCPADRLDRAGRPGARRLRLRQVGRRPDRHPLRRRLEQHAAATTSRSGTPTSPTASAIRSRGTSRSREARTRRATGTRSWSTRARADSTSCTTCATRSHGWTAGSGATWNLRSNHLRPAGWTSADAAGLPIFPGLARWDEVSRGVIDHALRFTAPQTRRAYVYPARHYASDSNDPALPPMGLRVRLKASVNIASFPPQARVVLRALQRYGMILADNGSPWYISGAPNRHWSTTPCTRSAASRAPTSRSSTRPRSPSPGNS